MPLSQLIDALLVEHHLGQILFVDAILIEYHIGQILLLGLLVTTVGALPLKSQQLIGLNTTLFGLIFVVTPASMYENSLLYLFLGLTLLVLGPVVYATAKK